MTASEILHRAKTAGVTLSLEAGRIVAAPRLAVTDELRGLVRENKQALLDALAGHVADVAQITGDQQGNLRRQRVLAMLAAHPEARIAATTDMEADPGAVLLMVAVRDVGTVELAIPRMKWDGVLFLDLLERHGATMH